MSGYPLPVAVAPVPAPLDPHKPGPVFPLLLTRRRRRLAGTCIEVHPVALDIDPLVALLVPVRLAPLLVRAFALEVAVGPVPLTVLPVPVARHPDKAGAGS